MRVPQVTGKDLRESVFMPDKTDRAIHARRHVHAGVAGWVDPGLAGPVFLFISRATASPCRGCLSPAPETCPSEFIVPRVLACVTSVLRLPSLSFREAGTTRGEGRAGEAALRAGNPAAACGGGGDGGRCRGAARTGTLRSPGFWGFGGFLRQHVVVSLWGADSFVFFRLRLPGKWKV